jgi:hypothetical protein
MLTLCVVTTGDLAILTAGTGATPVCGMRAMPRPGWRLNRSADMFVLLT